MSLNPPAKTSFQSSIMHKATNTCVFELSNIVYFLTYRFCQLYSIMLCVLCVTYALMSTHYISQDSLRSCMDGAVMNVLHFILFATLCYKESPTPQIYHACLRNVYSGNTQKWVSAYHIQHDHIESGIATFSRSDS